MLNADIHAYNWALLHVAAGTIKHKLIPVVAIYTGASAPVLHFVAQSENVCDQQKSTNSPINLTDWFGPRVKIMSDCYLTY